MVAATYDESLRRLLVHEGGYTNHPSDPGGPTNFGITIHDARKYWKAGASAADVRAMSVEVAKGIYRSKYWRAMRCDELPAGVDYCIFDYGVNSGIGRAPKVLQRILTVDVTGTMSDRAIKAAKEADAKWLVNAICDERLRFLRALRTWPVFGAGWGRRLREVRAAALKMTEKTADKGLPPTGATVGKGEAPVNKGGQNGTAGGVIAAGGTAAETARQSGMSTGVIVAIVVITIALAIGGWIYWNYRAKQQQDAPA